MGPAVHALTTFCLTFALAVTDNLQAEAPLPGENLQSIQRPPADDYELTLQAGINSYALGRYEEARLILMEAVRIGQVLKKNTSRAQLHLSEATWSQVFRDRADEAKRAPLLASPTRKHGLEFGAFLGGAVLASLALMGAGGP